MSMVKGAGDTDMRDNPPVTSKFERDHGMPRKPASVAHPGGVAKPTGSGHAGHMESGHMMPQEVAYHGSDKLK